MDATKTIDRTKSELMIALGVFIGCLGLIAIDSDTKTLKDIVDPSNIVALFIYFTPTFILSCLLYRLFARKQDNKNSIILSLVIGVPLGFALLIMFFNSLNH
jgi:RsiW-degrading membrane proteinase PrsW (M82 family)